MLRGQPRVQACPHSGSAAPSLTSHQPWGPTLDPVLISPTCSSTARGTGRSPPLRSEGQPCCDALSGRRQVTLLISASPLAEGVVDILITRDLRLLTVFSLCLLHVHPDMPRGACPLRASSRKASLLQPLKQRLFCFALHSPRYLAAAHGTDKGMWSGVHEPVTCVDEHMPVETVLVRELP